LFKIPVGIFQWIKVSRFQWESCCLPGSGLRQTENSAQNVREYKGKSCDIVVRPYPYPTKSTRDRSMTS